MANGQKKDSSDAMGDPGCRSGSFGRIALKAGLTMLAMCSSVAGAADGRVELAYASDLSLPLWGGGIAAVSAMEQTALTDERIPLHHFDQISCGSCHAAPAVDGGPADRSGWKTGVDVNRSCTSLGCHEYDDRMNHPLDVPLPARTVGQTASNSMVTCLSCHQLGEQAASSDGRADRFLQPPQQVGCGSCHERLPGSGRRQAHWKFSQKAHLVSLTPGIAENKSEGMGTMGGIDSESNACLSCHDEVTVTIPALHETPRQKADRYRTMTDHPIGMNYQAVLAQNPTVFHSLPSGSGRIRMFDGRVGCGSCHSPYSDLPANLAAEYNGSVLCRTCHNR